MNTERLFQTHRFEDLLPLVKRVFKEAGWLEHSNPNAKFGTYNEIENLILGLEEIDPKAFAFRYPVDTKGDAHLPSRFHFNVIALAEEVSAMLRMLDGAATGVYKMFQGMASIVHEYADQAW